MATRSTIALEFADGTVGQVYCHWDGYLAHNGKMLQEHYSDPFKLRDLIDHGDLSTLAIHIGSKHDFDTQVPYECTFYGRDRGETDTQARYFPNFDEYFTEGQMEDFNYILRTDGNWYVREYDSEPFVLLTEALKRDRVGLTI